MNRWGRIRRAERYSLLALGAICLAVAIAFLLLRPHHTSADESVLQPVPTALR